MTETTTAPPAGTDGEGFYDASRDVQLPLFEGWKIERARIGFAGSLEFDADDDPGLLDAMRLGKRVTLEVNVAGRTFEAEATVTNRTYQRKRPKGADKDTGEVLYSGYTLTVDQPEE